MNPRKVWILSIEYARGRTFVVSVDDADTGAALINTVRGPADAERSR